MIVKTEIVMPNVYVLTFDTQFNLCMGFVRMQEFYESQEFRGKYFTIEDFMKYWAENFGRGSFDYPIRWNGFNLPSKAINKWRSLFESRENEYAPHRYIVEGITLSSSIRERETEILHAIKGLLDEEEERDGKRPKKYYVIGVHAGKSEESRQEVIRHECAHALYYLYPEYMRECNALIEKSSETRIDKATKQLDKMGYGKNVFKDEIQAYFSTEEQNGFGTLSGMKRFANNFSKYSKKWAEK